MGGSSNASLACLAMAGLPTGRRLLNFNLVSPSWDHSARDRPTDYILPSGDGSKMNIGTSSLKGPRGLFLAAAALRLALFFVFPGLPELVAGRVEVSTPVNSFKRCLWSRANASWT